MRRNSLRLQEFLPSCRSWLQDLRTGGNEGTGHFQWSGLRLLHLLKKRCHLFINQYTGSGKKCQVFYNVISSSISPKCFLSRFRISFFPSLTIIPVVSGLAIAFFIRSAMHYSLTCWTLLRILMLETGIDNLVYASAYETECFTIPI